MDVLIESLDKQIRGNVLDMTTAIVRLEQMLSRGTLEDARSLHSILPKFLQYLFGTSGRVGWLELAKTEIDLRAIYSFLRPENVFVSFLLLHSNEAAFSYEFAEAEVCPKISVSIFNSDGRSIILGQKRSIKMSMFEYYLFFFCQVLRTPHVPRGRNISGNRRLDLIWEELVTDHHSLTTFGDFYWHLDDHAEIYFMLLSRYLDFCLPLNLSNSQSSLFNSRVFLNVAAALKMAEFCLGMFLEVWVLENVQGLYKLDTEGIVCKPPRIMTLDLIKAIQVILRHFLQFHAEAKPSVMSRLSRNPLLDEFGKRFLETFMIETYRFLRIYISGWPHDASISGLISLWDLFNSGFEKPFLGMQVLGRDLLEHLIITLGHLGSVPLNQVDWPAMNSQLAALLQCTSAVLSKLCDNLSWLQAWEEQLPEEAREQIRKYEIESFQLHPFLSEEDVALALVMVLERLHGMLNYSEPMHNNKQLLENCAGLLQKCFLVRVDLSKSANSVPLESGSSKFLDRQERKRILIEQEGGNVMKHSRSLVATVWSQLLSSPIMLYSGLLFILFAYIWIMWL